MLELLLILGTPRKDCKEQARALLKHFGSLSKVLEASPDELQKIKGVGPNNSFAILFLHGVARRYLKDRVQDKRYLYSSSQVAEYLIHSMRDLQHEAFTAIFLDSSHAIIDTRVVARGTVSTNTIYPRELVKQALERLTHRRILPPRQVHNTHLFPLTLAGVPPQHREGHIA